MLKRIKTENYIVVNFTLNKKKFLLYYLYYILYQETNTRHTKYKFITVLNI